MESEQIFSTLALGAKFSHMADDLASDLLRHCPAAKLVVLTDEPEVLRLRSNVIAIKHRQVSVKPFHDKLCAVDRALQFGDSCIFMDADSRILGNVELEPGGEGVEALIVRSWAYNQNELADLGTIHQSLRKRFGLRQDDAELPYVVECLFRVTRDEHYEQFREAWASISSFCQRRRFFIFEGYALALAAFLTGVPVRSEPFTGLRFVTAGLPYDFVADFLSEEAHRDICMAMDMIKVDPHVAMRRRILGRLETEARWIKMSAFGLKMY